MSTLLPITLPISGSLSKPLVDYLETLRLSKRDDKAFNTSINTITEVLLVISKKTSKSTIVDLFLIDKANPSLRLYSRLPYLYTSLRRYIFGV